MIVDRNTEYVERPQQPNGADLLRAVQLAIESGRDFHGLPLLQIREYLLTFSGDTKTVSDTPRTDALLAAHTAERDGNIRANTVDHRFADRTIEMAVRHPTEMTLLARQLERELDIINLQCKDNFEARIKAENSLRHCEQAKRIADDIAFGLEQLRPRPKDNFEQIMDAQRYRWLRDNRLSGRMRGVLFAQAMGWMPEDLTPEQIDERIDEARK